MHLTKLILEQFRNYRRLELDFDPDQPVTSIVGQNAQGKTNILEAIYILALTKSFRTSQQSDLIQWGTDYARVQGFFEMETPSIEPEAGDSSDQNENTNSSGARSTGEPRSCVLEAFFGNPPQPRKSLKLNHVKTSAENFIGNCQVVFFHPEDLNLLYLGPDLRRRYLDVLNLQVNKKYYRALRAYRRVIEQRNSLLKAIKDGFASADQLDVWDEQLVTHGSLIMEERAKTVAFLNKHLTEQYRRISERDETVEAQLQTSLVDRQGLSAYAQALKESRHKDLQTLFTTVGPHRDDLQFKLNGRSLESHASRGEYRSLLLALKLLEIRFIEEKTSDKPLLLLDDVFSELDLHRQKMLLEAIEGHQTIITTTHIDEEAHIHDRTHAGLKNGLARERQLMVRNGEILGAGSEEGKMV